MRLGSSHNAKGTAMCRHKMRRAQWSNLNMTGGSLELDQFIKNEPSVCLLQTTHLLLYRFERICNQIIDKKNYHDLPPLSKAKDWQNG